MNGARGRAVRRVVIVEDEPPARRKLERFLAEQAGVELVGQAGDGLAGVQLIEQKRPDIVLLDVQMPELDGFEVLRALEGEPPHVIFVTAYDEFALRAFEVEAVDYLMKPVERARLSAALSRALTRSSLGSSTAVPPVESRASRFLARKGDRLVPIRVDDVVWLEAAGNYVRLHCQDGAHLVRGTLTDLARRLDPDRFVRVHRSSILSLDDVERFDAESHGDWIAHLVTGDEVRVSRRYRQELESRWIL